MGNEFLTLLPIFLLFKEIISVERRLRGRTPTASRTSTANFFTFSFFIVNWFLVFLIILVIAACPDLSGNEVKQSPPRHCERNAVE